jgi:hypothetical protein
MTFEKFDNGKAQMSLLDPHFIEGIAEVLTIGAKKYSPDNWKRCKDKSRYVDALYRHFTAYMKGEEVDPESGLSHLYHMGCNIMFLDFFDREDINEKL